MTLTRVGVVGTGLIGTSVGLALRAGGLEVLLHDADPHRADAAAALGAGQVDSLVSLGGCEHVVVAVPPSAVAETVNGLLQPQFACTVSDVSSVKSKVLVEIESVVQNQAALARFCGGHPIAGRERHGPGAAQPELFENAVWVVTPGAFTGERARADVVELAATCGARPVVLDAATHDTALAAISHAPQVVASMLAALLPAAGPAGPELAGPGFRDTTRLADSDPSLWADIAIANAAFLAPFLTQFGDRLLALAAEVTAGDGLAVAEVLAAGRVARAALPGKAHALPGEWARVGVVLPDRPGELGRLLTECGAVGVNVEDLTIEHARDHPAGFVDLSVSPQDADRLIADLRGGGWAAHRSG